MENFFGHPPKVQQSQGLPFYQMRPHDSAFKEMAKAQREGLNRPGGPNGGEDLNIQAPYGPPPGQSKTWEEFEQ